LFSKIIQNIFFKGARALPKPVFKDRAGRLGNASLCEVTRNGGAIKVLTVSPVAGSTKCTCHCGAVVVMAHPISRKAKYFFTESVRAERYLQCGATVVGMFRRACLRQKLYCTGPVLVRFTVFEPFPYCLKTVRLCWKMLIKV